MTAPLTCPDGAVSARKLSALAGLSNAVVTRLVREHRPRPGALTVNALAKVLGVELGWLLDGTHPCIAARPELDPANPADHPAIAAFIRAAVEAAEAASEASPRDSHPGLG